MNPLKRLFQEIHQRSLWQIVGIYLGASWVVLQVIEVLMETVGLPDWVAPFAIVLLLIGLPVVVATAFVQHRVYRGAVSGSAEAPAPAPGGVTPDESAPAHAERAGLESAGAEGVTEGAATRAVEPALTVSAQTVPAESHRGLLTWRNVLISGVLAFSLLGLATAAYMIMRTAGIGPVGSLVARGVLDTQTPIVLADFEAQDPALSRAATEAFRVDLSQSPDVKLAEPALVAEGLRRMARDPDAPLSAETARELAVREGMQAVIAGQINPVGAGYVLSAEIVSADGGQVLASRRETAADSTELITAIDKLSSKLRERIGESLTSIRAKPPLERVTTGSLEALRKYSEALKMDEQGRQDQAIALLEEAVALDTAFAMAYRKLGVLLTNPFYQQSRASDATEALKKAFQHRGRLTQRERDLTTASYHMSVSGEDERAITALESVLASDPQDAWALNNLGVVYSSRRDYGRAAELFRRSIEVDTLSTTSYGNLVGMLVAEGNFSEGRRLLETYKRRFPGNPGVDMFLALLAAAQGNYAEAEQQVLDAQQRAVSSPAWVSTFEGILGALDGVQGKLGAAEEHYRRSLAFSRERGLHAQYLLGVGGMAFVDIIVRGDTTAGLERMEAALEEVPLSSLAPLDRPYLFLASVYAMGGEPDLARELVAEFEQRERTGLRLSNESALHGTGSAIATTEGRYDDAVTEARLADVGSCAICALPNLAVAYDLGGQADSAIAVYERYVSNPAIYRLYVDITALGPIHERLGQLYDEREDSKNAALHYARFVELWQEADPELQQRVQAAQRRIDQIVAETG